MGSPPPGEAHLVLTVQTWAEDAFARESCDRELMWLSEARGKRKHCRPCSRVEAGCSVHQGHTACGRELDGSAGDPAWLSLKCDAEGEKEERRSHRF